MTAGQTRYRYPLTALEKLYTHRLEQARLALVAAQRRLDDHQGHIQRLRIALGRSHEDWAAAAGRSKRFDPASHAAVREALAVHQSGLSAALEQERQLLAEVDQFRERVTQAHRHSETVERHKDQSRREFELEWTRMDQRRADAEWPAQGERYDGF